MHDDIGGEKKLRELAALFHELVETLPEGANLRRLPARGHRVAHARVEQFNFLSGFIGGRAYYKEKHGHMDVKLIHAHVSIRRADAENWLICMLNVLAEEAHAGHHIDKLSASFERVAML